MNRQVPFGGIWTEQKLQILSGYLREYRKIFQRNPNARFYEVTYLDAFAGTGRIPRKKDSPFVGLLPELEMADEEFRSGSVRRALEINPPFHRYVFIEKHGGKYQELDALAKEFPDRNIEVVNSDANDALLRWCQNLNRAKQRAVVFMDPFGTCVRWETIETLANTKAIDLWILFPCATINRMLPSKRKPPKAWSERLTSVFGTSEWETQFYGTDSYESLLHAGSTVNRIRKLADHRSITEFFLDRMRTRFTKVSRPGYLCHTRGPLFALIFAAGNEKGAGPGLRIAEHLLRKLD